MADRILCMPKEYQYVYIYALMKQRGVDVFCVETIIDEIAECGNVGTVLARYL